MIFSSNKSIEDFIVEKLTIQGQTATNLFNEYTKLKPVTLQAFYKSLAYLINEGIVVKHKHEYILDNNWKMDVAYAFQNHETIVNEGESIQYSFHDPAQADKYWRHAYQGVAEKQDVIYFYCPHKYWSFIPGHAKSEADFYLKFKKDKKKVVLLVGGNTLMDKEIKKRFVNPYVEIHNESNHPLSMNDHLTIRNDVVVTTKVSPRLAKKLNEIFDKNLPIPETEKLLTDAFKQKNTIKIIIERNKTKAEKLKKQIGKYFF